VTALFAGVLMSGIGFSVAIIHFLLRVRLFASAPCKMNQTAKEARRFCNARV